MGKVKITQVKSAIRRPADQKRTLIALGIKKLNKTREVEESPAVMGMIRKVEHLLKVEKDRKSTRLNSSHDQISYAVFCLKKKKKN